MTPYEMYKTRLERLTLFVEYAAHQINRMVMTWSARVTTHFRGIEQVAILRRDLHSIYKSGGLGYQAWQPATVVSKSTIIEHGTSGGLLIAINDGGTTGGAEPALPANSGDQVTDGGVTWERIYDSQLHLWDQRFAAVLVNFGVQLSDYEHYRCARPPLYWQSGLSVAVGDLIIHRYYYTSTADPVPVFTWSTSYYLSCLNAPPPTGVRPPYIPIDYIEPCGGVWVPPPTLMDYQHQPIDYRAVVALYRVAVTGTLGANPPDVETMDPITHNSVATHGGTAEIRFAGVFVVVNGDTYPMPTITGFPDRLGCIQ